MGLPPTIRLYNKAQLPYLQHLISICGEKFVPNVVVAVILPSLQSTYRHRPPFWKYKTATMCHHHIFAIVCGCKGLGQPAFLTVTVSDARPVRNLSDDSQDFKGSKNARQKTKISNGAREGKYVFPHQPDMERCIPKPK